MTQAYPNPHPDPSAYTNTKVVSSCKKLDTKTEAMFNNDPSIIQNLNDVNLASNGPMGINTAAVIDPNAKTIFVSPKVTSWLTE